MAMARLVLALVVAFALISMTLAIPGTATYYTTYVPSSCYGFTPQGPMIAAANPALFDNRRACGKFCTVKCTGSTNQIPGCRDGGGQITVKIVDLCPGCAADQLDLSQPAFEAIGNTAAGKIRIEYTC